MKQVYDFNSETLPTIITPHDCYITAVELKDGWLTFTFDDDIMHGEDCPIGYAVIENQFVDMKAYTVKLAVVPRQYKAQEMDIQRSRIGLFKKSLMSRQS